jgi:hypothetical protein
LLAALEEYHRLHPNPKKIQDIASVGQVTSIKSLSEKLWQAAGPDGERESSSTEEIKGSETMKARKKTSGENTKAAGLPRIFVQIASYRDPQCQWTVQDLFQKAKHPERIFVGICWQFIKKTDNHCFVQPYPFPKQVRVTAFDASESLGQGWARQQAQQLWKDEEYTLQIDSCSRFDQDWDERLLSMWTACENDKAVLTCYPPEFTPPDQYKRNWVFGMTATEFSTDGVLNVSAAPPYEVGLGYPFRPLNGAFASYQMLFGPASVIKDVPCDPYLSSEGEDVALAVRLWTSGYNLFHPHLLVLFHGKNKEWVDAYHADHIDWELRRTLSLARVQHLLNTKESEDKVVLEEIEQYGLGKARSLSEYQSYSGVNFAQKKISAKAREGKYEALATQVPTTPLAEQALQVIEVEKRNRITGKLPKIFVNIASYRDPECQWTVKNLYEKAKYPDRIFVGICWQFDEKEDQHCFEVITRPEQVRIIPVDWREAEGVCWARYQTQLLWDGEDYTFMTDSHMRFVQDWDEKMILELARCESDKPLLSSSPASYKRGGCW